MGRFGISQPVPRREDDKLLRGQGRFADDVQPEGALHAIPVRSPYANAMVSNIDTSLAATMSGVRAVFTAADLAADGVGSIPCLTIPKVRAGTSFNAKHQPLLAHDRVRFAGECIAFVVAETREQARDAAELVTANWQPLPAVIQAVDAARADAPLVWEDLPANACFDFEMGDASAVENAFRQAQRIVSLNLVNNRIVQNALETRAALGWHDPTSGKMTLLTPTQMPHKLRDQLASAVFHVPSQDVRVLVEDVGGSFGGKNSLYVEQALVLYAARRLRRPVKWVGERSDAFLSDYHGRDNTALGELALDADGRFLAVRLTGWGNLGAYTTNGGPGSPTAVVMLPNAYVTPHVHIRVRGVYTNTVPTDSYRGAGRPEMIYLMERLVDAAARECGLEPAELRRRNAIPPNAFPYTSPTGLTYTHADFIPVLEQALAQAGVPKDRRRAEKAVGERRLRGFGISNYIERCGGGGGLSEVGRILFDADGSVTVYSGSMSNGQGHATAFSQIVNEKLGLPFEKIRVVQGDTDQVPNGTGTGGSWSVPMGGGAISLAADRIIEKAKRIAAHLTEVAEADLILENGMFKVAGTDLGVSIEEVARAAHDPKRLPTGVEPGLDEQERFAPNNYTYPYGCHICEVEVDPDTGHVAVIAYTAVHDFGKAINPMLLAGQVHGGVVQGIGQALFEHTVYDSEGQLLSGSFMDYCLPRAADLPAFHFDHLVSPSPTNPLDIKGCGEAGATGAPPAVINAILDALAPLGVRHIDMPATPERVWRAIQEAKGRQSPADITR